MDVKLFEVRDAATFLPIMAIRLTSRNDAERYLLSRTGYGTTERAQERYVLVLRLAHGRGSFSFDPHDHGNARTLYTAHRYIIENWDSLESGQVVCVEHILGERPEPKPSERFDT